MLRTRVITAVAILPVLLGMLFFASPGAWALFVLAIALIGCWEWARMSVLSKRAQPAYLALSGAIGIALWALYAREGAGVFTAVATIAFAVSAIFWIAVATSWLAKKLRPNNDPEQF